MYTKEKGEKRMKEILQKLETGNYRSAAESVVEIMKNIAVEQHDKETVAQLENILAKLFDIPNIDWKKAEEHGVYEILTT